MERLPRGRHGLSADFVANNQRERLIAGVAEALYEVGYGKTTVSLIGQKAAVSKSDFYKHFKSKDECFYAAYEDAVERIRGYVQTACESNDTGEWAQRVRDGLEALLGFLSREPALANLTFVEGLGAGRGVYDRYQEALEGFVSCLREGAPSVAGEQPAPATVDEAVIGGIASLVGRRVLTEDVAGLGALLPEALEFTLTPYLGVAEARRIVSAG
jgi:AcrR family transcriptional regulator